jgi:hypothetical protein
MPMKSKAQRRKFAELLVKGEISEEVYERWNRETGRKELPERVTPKAKRAKRRSPTAKKKTTTVGKKTTTARKRTATAVKKKTAAAKKRTVARKSAKKR